MVRLLNHRSAGFSSAELLVAMLLMLIVTAAAVALVQPTTTASQTQPEAMDMQQRARVASFAVFRDLLVAGAGLDAGPRTGPLVDYFAPIIPRRIGLRSPDAYTVARPDAVTITYVPDTASQTRLLSALPSASTPLAVEPMSGCPGGQVSCGLGVRDALVIFDDLGHFDVFTVTAASAAGSGLAAHRADATYPYQTGAAVAEVVSYSYYFDAARRQLRRYDGYKSDVPMVDHVVGVSFTYFGDPRAPVAPRPPVGTANCLYDATGAARGGLLALTPSGGSLAALPLAMFSDGPWCGSGQNRFDADLLRVRQVRVTIRVESGPDTFRSSGAAFAAAGSSREALRDLPDYLVTFGVSPRNLNLGR